MPHAIFVVSQKLCAFFVLQPSSYSVNHGTSYLYRGYPRTLANLKADTKIPLEVREQGYQALLAWVQPHRSIFNFH